MVGLIDITPAVEVVDVQGYAVKVSGLSVEAIGHLFLRFPKFRQMVESNKWDVGDLLKMSDEAINAVIANSCNGAIDEDTARKLTLGDKAEILAAVFRVTMPKGPGPFVALMRTFGLVGDVPASSTDSATTSASRSNSSARAATRRQASTHPE